MSRCEQYVHTKYLTVALLCSLRIMELMLIYIDITGFWQPHLLATRLLQAWKHWIWQHFHLVAGLETPCNNLEIIQVIRSGYMASTFKVHIWTLQFISPVVSTLVILLTHWKDASHGMTSIITWCVSCSSCMVIKLTLQVPNNHLSYNYLAQKMPPPCDNVVATL